MLHGLLAGVVLTGEAFWAKDLLFDRPELGRRLDPQIVEQANPPKSVRVERFCLAPAAVQRDHQQREQVLARGVFSDEALQFADDLPLTA